MTTIDREALYSLLRNSGFVTSSQASELADRIEELLTGVPKPPESRDFTQEYQEQKALSKKELYKLKPGTWVEVRWLDSPNTVHLLTERVIPDKGDLSVEVQSVIKGRLHHRSMSVTHDQIVAMHGMLTVEPPKPNRS